MKWFLSLLTLFVCCFGQLSIADIVVVANKDNQIEALTKKQIIDIYMGRKSTFPNGEVVLPIDQEIDSTTRKLFYQNLVNKTVSEINTYWARLLFSGRATPPRPANNGSSVINIIKNNKSAIGYIKLEDITDDVRVLRHVD
jgi:ABC-type phosphate transport system substrate-binding protein